MNREEMIAFINSNLACNLATVENNEPRVRGMMAYRAEQDGILFHTGKPKDVCQQILKNPAVEICFFNPQTNVQLRVKGTAVIVDDLDLKKEIVEARTFLKPWVEQKGYEPLIVFKVVHCVATIWTFQNNFLPKEYVQLTE